MITGAKIIGSNIPYETYSKQPDAIRRGDAGFVMSRSELMDFALCPEKWLSKKEDSDTPATTFGSLVECLETGTLEGSKFVIEPLKYQTSKGQEADWTYKSPICREWKDEQEAAGKCPISRGVLQQAREAVTRLKAYQPRKELFECSEKQVMVTAQWQDKATGLNVPLRCLIDLVPRFDHPDWGKCLCDAKTARNGNPAQWARVVDDSGYDWQAALSLDLYVAATREDRNTWIWPLSENEPPYHVVKPMPAATQEFLEWGRLKYRAALRLYAQCLSTGEWPSYSSAGLIWGNVQLIGPEELWSYRKTAGQSPLPPTPQQPEPTSEHFDIIP
jgi:hypothetical protein